VYQVPSKEEEGTSTNNCDTTNSAHDNSVDAAPDISMEIREAEAYYAVGQPWPKQKSRWDKRIQSQIHSDKEALLTRLEHGGIISPALAPGTTEPRKYYSLGIEHYYRSALNRGRKIAEQNYLDKKEILCRHEEDKFLSDFVKSTREEANMIANMICPKKAAALQKATKEFVYVVRHIPVRIRGDRSPLCKIRDCLTDEGASKNDVTIMEFLKVERVEKASHPDLACTHEINSLLRDFVKTVKTEAKSLINLLPSDEKATVESAIKGIANVAEWIQFRNSEKSSVKCDITPCYWYLPNSKDLVFKLELDECQDNTSDVDEQAINQGQLKPYVETPKIYEKEVLESLAMVTSRLHHRRLRVYENSNQTSPDATGSDLNSTPEGSDGEIDIADEQSITSLKQG
jgi:hypothetical protein